MTCPHLQARRSGKLPVTSQKKTYKLSSPEMTRQGACSVLQVFALAWETLAGHVTAHVSKTFLQIPSDGRCYQQRRLQGSARYRSIKAEALLLGPFRAKLGGFGKATVSDVSLQWCRNHARHCFPGNTVVNCEAVKLWYISKDWSQSIFRLTECNGSGSFGRVHLEEAYTLELWRPHRRWYSMPAIEAEHLRSAGSWIAAEGLHIRSGSDSNQPTTFHHPLMPGIQQSHLSFAVAANSSGARPSAEGSGLRHLCCQPFGLYPRPRLGRGAQ